MSAAKSLGDKLSARLRELYATLRRQTVESVAAPAAPAATEPQEASPRQRLLTGPETTSTAEPLPQPLVAGAVVRATLFDSPDPRFGERLLFLERFVRRFHEAMRQSGVLTKDPLHSVLTTQTEMLVHSAHLQADLLAAFKQRAGQLVGEVVNAGEKTRETLAGVAKETAEALVKGSAEIRVSAAMVQKERVHVANDLGAELKATLRDYALGCTWNAWLVAVAIQVVAALAVAAGGIWFGRLSEQQSMALTLKALKQPLVEAVMRDGNDIGLQWLDIIQWNHLGKVSKTCKPYPSGSGYRLACTMSFWFAPPLAEPPPS